MDITLICITEDGTLEVVNDKLFSMPLARQVMRIKILASKAQGSRVSYRRFVMVATHAGVEGVHLYDEKGNLTKELFV
jgi:hypothetical protein